MTGYLKIALLSMFAFAAPVGFALLVSPFLFEKAFSPLPSTELRARRSVQDEISIRYQEDLEKTEHGKGLWYARIGAAQELDPRTDGVFLVSFLVRFKGLPKEKFRHNIIEKYETSKRPYPGWAVGIQRINGSIRPQVYWRDSNSNGGWFTFDAIELVKNQWYSLTLIARDSKYLSLYIEQLETDSAVSPEHSVRFLGGHTVEEIGTPATTADMSLGVLRANGKSFQGDFGYVVIARPRQLLENVGSLVQYLAGGAVKLRDKLSSEDLLLSINESWQDESPFQHQIERS